MNHFPDLGMLFLLVLRVSWQASLLVFLVLGVQFLFRNHLPLRWRSALWLIVLARLVLPDLPVGPLSFYQIAPSELSMSSLQISPEPWGLALSGSRGRLGQS